MSPYWRRKTRSSAPPSMATPASPRPKASMLLAAGEAVADGTGVGVGGSGMAATIMVAITVGAGGTTVALAVGKGVAVGEANSAGSSVEPPIS